MLTITTAQDQEDFEAAAGFCQALAAWDALVAPSLRIAPELVVALYHSDCSSKALKAQFCSNEARMLIASWDGQGAGCLGFSPFDASTTELHKFYVDPRFRGRGIGRALLETMLVQVAESGRKAVMLNTTIYMKNAVALYQAVGFARCPPFRTVPEEIAHTEIFMSRPI